MSTPDLELRIERDSFGVALTAYTSLFQQVSAMLQEIDRHVLPGRVPRLTWAVRDTYTETGTLVVSLSPRKQPTRRPLGTNVVTTQALIDGVRVLEQTPEIPRYFDENSVQRVVNVGDRLGRDGITGLAVAMGDDVARIDQSVQVNAREAVTEASSSFSSVVGRLDQVSVRRGRRRVGLLTDVGRAVTCEVDRLDEGMVLASFDTRVVVSGLLRRNGLGQPVRLEAEAIEPAPPRAKPVSVDDLVGVAAKLWPGLSNDEVMDQVRERRAG